MSKTPKTPLVNRYERMLQRELGFHYYDFYYSDTRFSIMEFFEKKYGYFGDVEGFDGVSLSGVINHARPTWFRHFDEFLGFDHADIRRNHEIICLHRFIIEHINEIKLAML